MDTEHVKKYIKRNVKRVYGVAPLAADLEIPAETLRKQFRRREGIPISRFIRLVKVEIAKKLLAETDKYCFEICYEVGFQREDGGSRTFKQVTGMTMGEYREANRGKQPCSGGDPSQERIFLP